MYKEFLVDVEAEFNSTLFADEGEDMQVTAPSQEAAPKAPEAKRGKSSRRVHADGADEDDGEDEAVEDEPEEEVVVTKKGRQGRKGKRPVGPIKTALPGAASARALPHFTIAELVAFDPSALEVGVLAFEIPFAPC